jgi:hypothetical protein
MFFLGAAAIYGWMGIDLWSVDRGASGLCAALAAFFAIGWWISP